MSVCNADCEYLHQLTLTFQIEVVDILVCDSLKMNAEKVEAIKN